MDNFEDSSWSVEPDFEEDNERTFEDWEASFVDLARAGDWPSLTEDLGNDPEAHSFLIARRREVVAELHQRSLTYRVIAKALGVSIHTVHYDATVMRRQSGVNAGAEQRSGPPAGASEADSGVRDEDQLAKTRTGNYQEIPGEVASPVSEEESAALLPAWLTRFTRNLVKVIKNLKR